jgi:molybdopterin molybdotransferase
VADLIPISEARELVLAAARPLPAEDVALDRALGRVLAEDVRSPLDVPPFDSSAMDGYALAADGAGELRVVGEARAGHPAAARVEPGTAIRISTGAAMPEGADAVVPVERVETDGETVRVPETSPGDNVRRAGEDVRRDDLVLGAGTPLGPAEIGVLASLGRARVSCAPRPRVALLVTGDELTEPGEELGAGRIFSSNSYALAGQVERAGGELVRRETVPDDAASTRAALEAALSEADLLCVSGGVSVGPHDHVKAALAELGVEERFWGVRLKPGKPTWFGVRDGVLVFGLPGNPVSAMVTFHLFAGPALRALQGAPPAPERASAVLDEPVKRNPRREQALRVRLEPGDDGWHAATTGHQGSHVLTSMLGASALALIPAGEGELAAGDRVEVELL